MKNSTIATLMTATALLGLTPASPAAVITQSETFTGAGSVPAGYSFSVSGGYLVNDLDFTDGVGDGAIFVDGNTGTPLSTVTFTLGTLTGGERQFTFTANLYQSSSSFGTTDVELLLDGSTVATVDPGNIGPAGTTAIVSYDVLPADIGKVLTFSISSDRNVGGSSDVGIDNWNLQVAAVPEPSSLAMIGVATLICSALRRRALPAASA